MTISEFGDHEFTVSSRAVTVVAGSELQVAFVAEAGPTTGTGVFLIITGVEDDDGDPDKTSGRVTATIDIERGDARFEKITLYVDGGRWTPGSSTLGVRPTRSLHSAAQVGVRAQPVVRLDEYDQDDPEGAVTYENGTYPLRVGVRVVGSEAEDYLAAVGRRIGE